MKRFWFFDLDGTLADTDRDIRETWKAVLKAKGLDCPNFDRDFVAGPPIDVMVRQLFPTRYTDELAAAIRADFGERYDRCGFPNTREYPGVLDAVRELKARGDYVAIVTNKRYAGATAMARRFGWGGVFDGLYAGDMYAATPIGKLAKPALLGKLLGELGAPREACTMVGDTISDFEAARANGIRALAVTWGYGKEAELRLADARISDARAILGEPASDA